MGGGLRARSSQRRRTERARCAFRAPGEHSLCNPTRALGQVLKHCVECRNNAAEPREVDLIGCILARMIMPIAQRCCIRGHNRGKFRFSKKTNGRSSSRQEAAVVASARESAPWNAQSRRMKRFEEATVTCDPRRGRENFRGEEATAHEMRAVATHLLRTTAKCFQT